jgi:hypothetical protein
MERYISLMLRELDLLVLSPEGDLPGLLTEE